MSDETQSITKSPVDNKTVNPESQLMSVSIRGWLALLSVFTVCLMSLLKIPVTEPLYTMTGMMIAFYYGQNKPAIPPPNPTPEKNPN